MSGLVYQTPSAFADEHVSFDGPGGTAIRNVKRQALHKWRMVDRLTEISTVGMKNLIPVRAYYEPLAATGLCRLIDVPGRKRSFVDGSPLRALMPPRCFTHFIFGDRNPEALAALKLHVRDRAPEHVQRNAVRYVEGDCNHSVVEVAKYLRSLRPRPLTVAFIDPTNWQWQFASTVELVGGNRVDLLLTFQISGMKRVLHLNHRPLYAFFGDDGYTGGSWYDTYRRAQGRFNDASIEGAANVTRALLDHYKARLSQLGYGMDDEHDEFLIRHPDNHAPLYYLLYASRHPRGKDFWRKVNRLSPEGSMQRLPGF